MGGFPQKSEHHCAVEAQAPDVDRIIIQVMESLVVAGVPAPERLRVPPLCMVVLVVARHVDDGGDPKFPADEGHAELPVSVGDVAGQDQQVAVRVRAELFIGARGEPAPDFKMEVRCDLDFHVRKIPNSMTVMIGTSTTIATTTLMKTGV